MSIERLLGRLEHEWAAFTESYAGLSDSALVEGGLTGQWSVRDILGHITTWEEESLKALSLILEGERLPSYSRLYDSIDAFNGRERERKSSLSLEQVKEQLTSTHQQLLSFLAGIAENVYRGDRRFQRRLRLDTYGHYREHVEQIVAWRRQRGL